MGSTPEGQSAASSRLRIFSNSKMKLIAFSIDQYQPDTQFFEHHEIQALVESPDKYEVLRISYSNAGLLIDFLSGPRAKIKYSKQRCIKISKYSQKTAFEKLGSICRMYADKEISFIGGVHCQSFCKEVRKNIQHMGERAYDGIWEIYDDL